MTDSPVLACRDLRDYFASEVHQATDRQHVALNGATEAYLADVLADLAERCHRSSPDDILRYYEIWQKTGSRRAHAKLAASGIAPVRGAAPGTAH